MDATGGNLSIAFKLVVYNGAGNFATVLTMDVSADDAALYLGGHLTAVSGVTRHHLAAVRASGGGLEGWDPGADGVLGAFGSRDVLQQLLGGRRCPHQLDGHRCRQP